MTDGGMTSIEDAKIFAGCNIVEGPVDIQIQSGIEGSITETLEKYLGDIEEVNDYVKVQFSPSLISLSFFKKLKIIRGKNLFLDK